MSLGLRQRQNILGNCVAATQFSSDQKNCDTGQLPSGLGGVESRHMTPKLSNLIGGGGMAMAGPQPRTQPAKLGGYEGSVVNYCNYHLSFETYATFPRVLFTPQLLDTIDYFLLNLTTLYLFG